MFYTVHELRFAVLIKINDVAHRAKRLRLLLDIFHIRLEFLLRIRSRRHVGFFLSILNECSCVLSAMD